MATDLSGLATALEQARAAAFVAGDAAAISDLLDDELVYIHSNGAADTKASLLALIGDGTLRYLAITPSIEQVIAIGSAGFVAAGILDTRAQLGDAAKILRGRYVVTWRQATGGGWKLIALQGAAAVA